MSSHEFVAVWVGARFYPSIDNRIAALWRQMPVQGIGKRSWRKRRAVLRTRRCQTQASNRLELRVSLAASVLPHQDPMVFSVWLFAFGQN